MSRRKTLSRCLLYVFSIISIYANPFFIDKVNAANGYLEPKTTCSKEWNNYPNDPISSASNSGGIYSSLDNFRTNACISKSYCSDIQARSINIGEFDRDSNDNIIYVDSPTYPSTQTQLTLDRACGALKAGDLCPENSCKVLESNGYTGMQYQKIKSLTETDVKDQSGNVIGKKCALTLQSPIIFKGIEGSQFDETTQTSQKILVAKPAILKNLNGHNGGSGSSQNCYLKSCADLTLQEFEAIYNTRFKNMTGNNPAVFYGNFCKPYKYDNFKTIGSSNIKYISSNIVYCHEFENKDVLKFLLLEGNSDNESVFHCRLHQCPILDSISMTCDSNYYLFNSKSQDFLKTYEEVVLNNTEPINSPMRSTICSSLYSSTGACSYSKYSVTEACDSQCDDYKGLDKRLIKDYSQVYDKFKAMPQYYEEQECSPENDCLKTIDCGIASNREDKTLNCNSSDSDVSTDKDTSLSYFYRPVPPASSVEVIDSDVKIKRILRGVADDINSSSNEGDYCTQIGVGGQKKFDDRPSKVKNYFRSFNDVDRNNICANGGSEFKEIGYFKMQDRFWFFGCFNGVSYNWGQYYSGFGHVTRPGTMPHIVPLCDTSSLGVAGGGRAYTCGNFGYICNVPNWDSYYVRGGVKYSWKSSEADFTGISVKVCMRFKNSGALNTCGNRECRVDCAFGLCLTQWCGIDRCVDLTLGDLESCTYDDIEKGKVSSSSGCYKTVSSGLRFRLTRTSANKVYVFLDQSASGCDAGTHFFGNLNNIRREVAPAGLTKINENPKSWSNVDESITKSDSTHGGTFRGRMDSKELFDDNSLTDNNCDGVITDEDIFGELLYKTWNCGVKTKCEEDDTDCDPSTIKQNIADPDKWCSNDKASGKRHPKCDTFKIPGMLDVDTGGFWSIKAPWVPVDIVQYIGNNQLTNGKVPAKCKVGDINNCRGFFDKDSRFFREQQSISLELPASPDFFYKYATIDNTPDLFLPLLVLEKFKHVDSQVGTYYSVINHDEKDIILDFFNPSVEVAYGINNKIITIPFDEIYTEGKISTKFGAKQESIETSYKLKKFSQLYPMPEAKVCLSQILSGNIEQQIKCLVRANPKIENFAIKAGFVANKQPYVNAYFHQEKLATLPVSSSVDVDDTSKFLPFYNNNDFDDENYKKLYGDSFAYSQNYPIYFESSYCSRLYYSCVTDKKDLQNEMAKIVDKNNDLIQRLQSKISACEREVEIQCASLNGAESLVQKVDSSDPNKSYIIKVKNNYLVDGAYNQMCVTKGFEKYSGYVLANYSSNDTLGKCILDDESKKKTSCRVGGDTESQKGYYAFCSILGNGCECLDGTTTCNCSNSNTCIKRISCQCSGDDCLSLNEACFKPGFNSQHSLLDADGKTADSCSCVYVQNANQSGINYEIRNATPRENGLCVDLMKINFCEPVKFYNKNKVYKDGGAGELLDYIKTQYPGNIWRTQQKIYGSYYFGNFGHAEFDKTVDCDKLLSDSDCCTSYSKENGCVIKNEDQCKTIKEQFCLLTYNCYNKLNGQKCESGQANCVCGNFEQGVCKGFWKEKTNTVPLAKCATETDEFGQLYGKYSLVSNTGCERYVCPTVTASEAIISNETDKSNLSELDADGTDIRGVFNGFATWQEYQKGSMVVENNQSYNNALLTTPELKYTDGSENAYGDDLEERRAVNCISGYGPAGLNYIRDNYMPVMANKSGSVYTEITDSATILNNQDTIMRSMIGFNMVPSKIGTSEYITSQQIYENYARAMGDYYARNYLPYRYCNQVGEWMGANDIYSKFGIELYNLKNSDIHSTNNKGFLDDSILSKYKITDPYKNAYCERLYCPSFDEDDIGLLSVESSDPMTNSESTYAFKSSEKLYYPNSDSSWSKSSSSCKLGTQTTPSNNNNYPEDPTNCSDVRGNTKVVNKFTKWRHAGGAKWAETPAPRFIGSVEVNGLCDTNKGFHPSNAIFYSTFDQQYNNIFNPSEIEDSEQSTLSNIKVKNIKDYTLYTNPNSLIQPVRTCGSWGQWSEVRNKCVATCEPLDVFRTEFSDQNKDGKLENHEITRIFAAPVYRSNFFSTSETNSNCKINGQSVNNMKCGDNFTGGAKWGRAIVGTRVVGECDAKVGKNNKYTTFPSVYQRDGIQFIRSGNPNDANKGAPYRDCQADGTWGPVVNPCVNFLTCPDLTITNADIVPSSSVADTIALDTLAGGSINISDADNANGVVLNVPLSIQCNKNFAFKDGGIIKKACNVTNGEWNDGFEEVSCKLKTCGAIPYVDGLAKMGSINDINSLAGNPGVTNGSLYYSIDSGLKGALALSGESYSGYKYDYTCPAGYEFKCTNCTGGTNSNETGGNVQFVCSTKDANSNNVNPYWKRIGECVPKTCKYSDLLAVCPNNDSASDGCKSPLSSPSIKVSGPITFTDGSVSKDNEVSVTTSVELGCASAYYEDSDNYAVCELNGTWSTKGTCKKVSCSSSSAPNAEASGAMEVGATVVKACNSGYSGSITYKCDLSSNGNGAVVTYENQKCYKDCASETLVVSGLRGSDSSGSCNFNLQCSGTCVLPAGIHGATSTCEKVCCEKHRTSGFCGYAYSMAGFAKFMCQDGVWVKQSMIACTDWGTNGCNNDQGFFTSCPEV